MKRGPVLTIWAILLFITSVALAWFPYTGFFLTLLGGYFWIGQLIHLVTLALIIDALSLKISPLFLIIPLALYSGYYISYVGHINAANKIEILLREENPSQIIQYNPSKHIIVTENANSLVNKYKIPVAYERNENFPEGFLSNRIISREQCDQLRNAGLVGKGITKAGHYCTITWWHGEGRSIGERLDSISQFKWPEIPDKDKSIISVIVEKPERNYSRRRKVAGALLNISGIGIKQPRITTYNFDYAGRNIGTFKSASIPVLYPFPLVTIGCFLNSASPAWECNVGLAHRTRNLDTFPATADHESFGKNPIAVLLQLSPYRKSDLDQFDNYEENTQFIESLIASKKNEKPEDFNEWGIKKDSPYFPQIGEKEGVASFTGKFHIDLAKGQFYEFMKANEGEVIYLNIQTSKVVNHSYLIGFCCVCKKNETCNERLDHGYIFQNEDGSNYNSGTPGLYEGYWLVGKHEVYNLEDGDTRTILTKMSVNPTGNMKDDISKAVKSYWDKKHKAEDCFFRDLDFPKDMLIYAAGLYEGKSKNLQSVNKNNPGQIDVTVNVPNKPIALIFSAHNPNTWNISYTDATHISAVVMTSYNKQEIKGLEQNIPILTHTLDGNKPCGDYIGFSLDDLEFLNPLSRRIFKKPADMFFPEIDTGKIIISSANSDLTSPNPQKGTPLPSSNPGHKYKMVILPEDEPLRQAREGGILRMATQEDTEEWINAIEAKEKSSPTKDIPPIAGMSLRDLLPKIPLHRTYVIEDKFTCPKGGEIKHPTEVNFIIAKGAPWPEGNCVIFSLYDLNSLKCKGLNAQSTGNGWCDIFPIKSEEFFNRAKGRKLKEAEGIAQ